MADGFVWYELVTNDMDKAVGFYSKVVGWDVRDSGMPGMRYMIFGKDGKDVGGMMTWAGAGAPGMAPEWMAHIHTTKLDEEVKLVVADGGTIIKPPQDIPGVGRFAVVLDPQHVKYLLFEPASTYIPPRLGQMEAGNVGWHELLTDDAEKAFAYYSEALRLGEGLCARYGADGNLSDLPDGQAAIRWWNDEPQQLPGYAGRVEAALEVLLHAG